MGYLSLRAGWAAEEIRFISEVLNKRRKRNAIFTEDIVSASYRFLVEGDDACD